MDYTPLKQKYKGDGSDGTPPGDCHRTAVASVLNLDPEVVPHFALFEGYWASSFCQWVEVSPYKLTVYDDGGDRNFWKHAAKSYSSVELAPFKEAPQNEILIASGHSPNGPWAHVVLWKDGALLWDPHHSNNGLKGEPYQYWKLS